MTETQRRYSILEGEIIIQPSQYGLAPLILRVLHGQGSCSQSELAWHISWEKSSPWKGILLIKSDSKSLHRRKLTLFVACSSSCVKYKATGGHPIAIVWWYDVCALLDSNAKWHPSWKLILGHSLFIWLLGLLASVAYTLMIVSTLRLMDICFEKVRYLRKLSFDTLPKDIGAG